MPFLLPSWSIRNFVYTDHPINREKVVHPYTDELINSLKPHGVLKPLIERARDLPPGAAQGWRALGHRAAREVRDPRGYRRCETLVMIAITCTSSAQQTGINPAKRDALDEMAAQYVQSALSNLE